MNKLTILSIKNSRWIHSWMKTFCNSTTLSTANIRKSKGASVYELLRLLMSLSFCDLAVWKMRGSKTLPARDAFYRFLAHPSYNWRKLLYAVSGAMIGELNTLTAKTNDRVLIIDESPYKRPASKAVQLLGTHYDHSDKSYYRGYRMLTAAWSDGHSVVPRAMELLTNADKKKRLGPDPDLDGRSHAGKRSKQALCKSTNLTVEMVEKSKQQGLPVDFVVFDSWYAQPSLLSRVAKHTPLVCTLKNNPKILYKHAKRIYTLASLYNKVVKTGRRKNKEQIIGSIKVQMLSGPEMRIVFIRDRREESKWLALASSDVKLTAQRICRIYAKRWGIEVFFKQIKQHLGLTRELQVRSYTACVAFTSIVFLRYMMLCYYHRQNSDDKTIPGLFYQGCQELQAMALHSCLQIVLLEILIMITKNGAQQAYQLAFSICGIVEKFSSSMLQTNSFNFKQLKNNCES